jgi:zona occludens toxin
MTGIASNEEGKINIPTQEGETQPTSIIPVSQPVIIALPSTKESFSMLSDAVGWSQVAACVSSKANCVCYDHKAQRLNIVPDTCNAAINYGWIVTNKR